jgi:putative ABC transport system permease protein
MNRILPDLLHGLRQLRRNPGVTLTALAALAIAIGANTAMFSVVDTVLLRPLPYNEPERVVMVWEDASRIGFPRNTPSPANWKDWQEQNHVFTAIAAVRGALYNLTGDGLPERAIGRRATANLWQVLGTKPLLGRTFSAEEDRTGAKVVVIGHGLWQRRYGADAGILGRKILLNDEPWIVIGVMPPHFAFPSRRTEIWTPAAFDAQTLARRGSHFLQCVARLRDGVTVQEAQAEMGAIAGRLAAQYPNTNSGLGAVVIPIGEQVTGDSRTGLILLFAASGFVLLIACANIANLLLATATARRRELAVRAALGAGRGVILRQLLTESLVLAGLGAALGLLVAPIGMAALAKLIPVGLVDTELHLDWRVLTFTALAAVLTGLLFGGLHGVTAGKSNLNEALRQGGRGSAGGRGHWLRDGLVVSQTALALALLTAAGLMVQTLYRLQHVDLGLRQDHLLTLSTDLADSRYPDAAHREGFFRAAIERVRRIPGVVNAGYTSALPLTEEGNTNGYIVEGQNPVERHNQDALFRVMTAGFLETMGARLREGRTLTEDDRAATAPVVLVNETLAKRHWPDGNAVGRRISLEGSEGKELWLTIAGVVHEVRDRGITIGTKPAVYMPLAQAGSYWPRPADLAIRTKVDPMTILPAVRVAIAEVDKDQPLAAIRTMDQVMEEVLGRQHQQMILFGGFAGLALVLAVTGIYGVISYVVAQRRREIGVRMALGATPGEILEMVFRSGGRLIAAGIVVGLALSMAGARLMASLLYEVPAHDPATLVLAGSVLAAAGLAACAIPARAAATVDPAIVLRNE